jgi:uncharacterized membrane protein
MPAPLPVPKLSTPAADTPSASADGGSNDADSVVRLTRSLALGSVVGLIVLGLAWELWLAPTGSGTLALKVLPLLLPLPGLWRYRMYTYRWLSLLVWLYFAEGVVRATTESGVSQLLAVAEILLCLLLFAVCAWHVRWRLARSATAAAPLS